MLFSTEEFATFAPLHMSHKPEEKLTTVSLIFFRPDSNIDQVKVFFGIKLPSAKNSNTSEEKSKYTNLIQFEKKLLHGLKSTKINTLELLMEKAPIFCENLHFRKLVWEELHTI